MEFVRSSEDFATTAVDLLALALVEGETEDEAFRAVDGALEGALSRTISEEGYKPREGATLLIHTHGRIPAARVLVVGLGKPSAWTEPPLRVFATLAVQTARSRRSRQIALAWPAAGELAPPEGAEELMVGALLGAYRFERLKSRAEDDERSASVDAVTLLLPKEVARKLPAATFVTAETRGRARAAGVTLARDLVNEPANVLTPRALAERAQAVAEGHPELTVEVLDRAALVSEGMGLLLAVAQGSAEPPALVHLTYTPPVEADAAPLPVVALVGKGVTFDSGGLDIKTREGMETMKTDMAGAAAVLGVMSALPVLRPRVVVHALLPATENMTGPSAYRPGDVIRGLAGKSVEILNTDAEGRLVLADALAYAVRLGADELIDLATLTGACSVALGKYTAGLFTNRPALGQAILAAAGEAGESMWELPLDARLKKEMRSSVADLKNVGGRHGGAIQGALFLEEFVEKRPFVHLDIAGPAYFPRAEGTRPQGGSGYGVLTLLRYLESRTAE